MSRDHSDHIVDQMNRRIHSGQGFIGSFDIPYDPSDLASLILIRIIPKARTLYVFKFEKVPASRFDEDDLRLRVGE